jgi:hypothetical protein
MSAQTSTARAKTVTAAVHYIRFEFTPEQVDSFATGPVRIDIEHPDDLEAVEPSETTWTELLGELRDRRRPPPRNCPWRSAPVSSRFE